MPKRKIAPMEMPQMWQEMICLAQNHPAQTLPLSWDWKGLRTVTLKNNLTALVYHGVQQNLPQAWKNHPAMIELRLLTKINRLRSGQRIQALVQIAQRFRTASIPVLSFKGPLLSQELYEDPKLRNSCDLDLLVAEENLTNACRCLQELGYEQQYSVWDATPKRRALRNKRGQQMHLVFYREGVAVELHWRICYRFSVSFETLWNSRRCFLLQEQPVDTLGKLENLCYLITHGAGHGYRQLRWLLELYTLLEKENFPVSQLYRLMKQRGIAMLLLETLLLFYRLPGFTMPDRLTIPEGKIEFQKAGANTRISWGWAAHTDMRRALALTNAVAPLLRRTNPEEGLDGRYYKHLLPNLANRPPFLLSLFAPDTPELEWLDLPDKWFFLYYVLRPASYIRGRRIKRHPSTHKATKNGDETQ